jgi:hypothetical protein
MDLKLLPLNNENTDVMSPKSFLLRRISIDNFRITISAMVSQNFVRVCVLDIKGVMAPINSGAESLLCGFSRNSGQSFR